MTAKLYLYPLLLYPVSSIKSMQCLAFDLGPPAAAISRKEPLLLLCIVPKGLLGFVQSPIFAEVRQ